MFFGSMLRLYTLCHSLLLSPAPSFGSCRKTSLVSGWPSEIPMEMQREVSFRHTAIAVNDMGTQFWKGCHAIPASQVSPCVLRPSNILCSPSNRKGLGHALAAPPQPPKKNSKRWVGSRDAGVRPGSCAYGRECSILAKSNTLQEHNAISYSLAKGIQKQRLILLVP